MKINYYTSLSNNNPVMEFIESLEKTQKKKIFKTFNLIEKYGLATIIPHTKKLIGTPFWEIKIVGKDSIRVIYILDRKSDLLAIHAFLKKTKQTPKRELDTAFKRYKEWSK